METYSVILDDAEQNCVLMLADFFNSGQEIVQDPHPIMEKLGIDNARYGRVMRTLATYKLINDPIELEGVYACHFVIEPKVEQAARQIRAKKADAEAPKDIVESVKSAARRNPVMAYVIIGVFVVTMALTAINQVVQLAKALKWLD